MRTLNYIRNNNVVLEFQLPGKSPSEINLSFEGRTLYLSDIPVYTVSEKYALDKAVAVCRHGLLTVTVPPAFSRVNIPILEEDPESNSR
jgi:HSP20 family molecular chaperone IbpA